MTKERKKKKKINSITALTVIRIFQPTVYNPGIYSRRRTDRTKYLLGVSSLLMNVNT